MNILIFYENEDIKIKQFIEDIVKVTEDSFNNKIKLLFKPSTKCKIDICMIVTNDITKINNIDKYKNIIVVTSNIISDHIIECVNISSDIYYLNKGANYILNKIKNRYMSNE